SSQTDLIPGTYRVFVQLSKSQKSRLHHVEVRADEETIVHFDAAYESAVHTSAEWTGLTFPSGADRERYEARFAARFATELGEPSAIVIGFDDVRGRPAITGALVDISSGRELRRASVAISP